MTRDETTALVERQARAWERGDVERLLGDFAPDALFIAPAGSFEGRQAIRAAIEDFLALGIEVRIDVTRVLADGDSGAVEWTWSERHAAGEAWRTAHDAIVFTARGGVLTSWREYFDPADLAPPRASS